MRKFFVISILFLLMVSCTNKNEKMLCKRWQVANVVFPDEKKAIVQSDTMQGNMQKVTENILRNILMKNIYEFHNDGTYKTGNEAASSTGKWKFEGKAIKFISENDSSRKEKIIPYEKLSEDSLILMMRNDQTSFEIKLVMVPMND